MFEKVKLGLALGGGGARGLAHIGVLKALEKAGVEISFIAGTSIGALIGASYAVTGSAAALEQKIIEFIDSDIYSSSGLPFVQEAYRNHFENWSQNIGTWIRRTYLQARFITSSSILDSELYREIIEFFIPKIRVEDLPVPFWAMGTDLKSGRAVVFKGGPLQAAVYASTAIPGLVKPLAVDDMLIVDGGVLNMVPVAAVKQMGAEVVIAVDVEKGIDQENVLGTPFDLLLRVEDVQSYNLLHIQINMADVIIRPDVQRYHWSEFNKYHEMIRLGRDEIGGRIDYIRTLSKRRKMPWHYRKNRFTPIGLDWLEV